MKLGILSGGVGGFWMQFSGNRTAGSEKKKRKSGRRTSPDDTFHADHQLNMGMDQDTTAEDCSVRNDGKSDRGKADAGIRNQRWGQSVGSSQ